MDKRSVIMHINTLRRDESTVHLEMQDTPKDQDAVFNIVVKPDDTFFMEGKNYKITFEGVSE